MNVLIVSGSFYGMRCGVGNYTYLLAKSLGDIGSMDISVLTSREASAVNDSKFQLFPTIDGWGFSSYRKILNLIKHTQPQIVHIQYPTIKYNKPCSMAIILLPAVIRLFFPKIQIIVSIHDFSIGHILSRLKQLPILAFSDVVIVSNERDREGMLKIYSYLANRIKKIYIGSNIPFKEMTEAEKTALKKTLCPNEEKLIVYFGYLTKGKKIDLLLNSFKTILDKGSISSRLAILGRPQTQEDVSLAVNLKDLGRTLGIDGKVFWIDSLTDEEVSAYLQCADLCVLPFARGADLRRTTLVSSIVHELPVVSTKSEKYLVDKELDEMGIAKLIDTAHDDLAYAIEGLLKDEELSESMRQSMRKVKDRFSWENIGAEYAKVYKELACRRDSAGPDIKETDFVLEVGSGDNPNERADVLCDLYLTDNTQRAYSRPIKVDGRPLVVCNAENLPFKSKSFDYIIASSLIEHLANPENFIIELERVGPRGYIEAPSILSEIIFGWPFHRWYIKFKKGKFIFLIKRSKRKIFKDIFHILYGKSKLFRYFHMRFKKIFFVMYEWNQKIPYEIVR